MACTDAAAAAVGIFAPPDVRPILKAYEGKNIPVEYAKREAERKQAAIEEWEREHGTAVAGASGAGWLSKVFGALGGVSGGTVQSKSRKLTLDLASPLSHGQRSR